MKIKAIYDNGGSTFDRYTVVFTDGSALGLSHNADSPQGVSQWGEVVEGEHLGNSIGFEELPENVQRHIIRRSLTSCNEEKL